MGGVYALRVRMNKGRTDMIYEFVGVSIQRSEFDEADHVRPSPSPISPSNMFVLFFR